MADSENGSCLGVGEALQSPSTIGSSKATELWREDEQSPGLTSAAEVADETGKQVFVEVFVGGLPSDASDEGVEAAFAAVGEVLSVRLNRRKKTGECKGFGFIRYADQETAERACAEVKEACGKPVGVHISRARSADQLLEEQLVPQEDADPDTSINKLLRLLRSHSDKKAAVAAALKAVLLVPSRGRTAFTGDKQLAAKGQICSTNCSDVAEKQVAKDDALLPDPATFLELYPRCKHLVDTFRSNPNTHNKTPLAILHEYATRLSLELMYNESADSNLGPFTVEAKLTSVGGAVLYATGEGRGRGKKDAKQVAAAGVLEMLLANVPETDFLQPGKAKILKVQVNPRAGLSPPVRSMTLKGRGRGRWAMGHAGRGAEYPGSQGPCSFGYEYGHYNTVHSGAQELYGGTDLYGLPSLSSYDIGGKQSYSNPMQDAAVLEGFRGNSLGQLSMAGGNGSLVHTGLYGTDVPLGLYGHSHSFDNSGFSTDVQRGSGEDAALLRGNDSYHSMGGLRSTGGVVNMATMSQLATQVAGSSFGLQSPQLASYMPL